MHRNLLYIILICISSLPLSAQPWRNAFKPADLMSIGVYYYPEQWPRSQWERDLKHIADLGFEFTHYAEFSWALLEPEEGKYEFGWLDDAINVAARAGLKVILCTPSQCPPAWMGEKYPEIYLVGADGRRHEHGIRGDGSLSNPRYLAYVDGIVKALAERYGHDPRIWGWQVDNEPQAVPDFSPSARLAFQAWLKQKYGDIAKMNEAWMGSFWSTSYDRFDQVILPNSAMNQEDKLSPHAVLDFQRFTADVTADFLNRQAELLRKYIVPEQWITTNYTNVCIGADPRRSDRLDFLSYTMYPVNGTNPTGGNSFRTGVPYKIYEACDYYRPVKGITGLMELQPGQVNWASVNPQPMPGVVHMWIMQAFGGGCSFLCTYRYRHPLGSSEMYHEGIVGTDGITLTQGGKEYVQAIGEMKQMRKFYRPGVPMPVALVRRKTAFLWNHENMWDLDIQPQTPAWNSWRNRNMYSAAVKSTGAPMDFISEQDDFSTYPFIVAPSYQMADPELVQKWKTYVEQGGNLILSCRTAVKDRNGHFFEGAWAEPIRSLIGADVVFFDMLPDGVEGHVKTDKGAFSWNAWSEVLEPYTGTEVMATYTDHYYSGRPAAVTRKLGKGTVTYIGVVSENGMLERQLVREVYVRAGVPVEDLPQGVYLEWRDNFYTGVNYSDTPYLFNPAAGSTILSGTNPLPPAEALVWTEGK
jgi:beta-galactosidase